MHSCVQWWATEETRGNRDPPTPLPSTHPPTRRRSPPQPKKTHRGEGRDARKNGRKRESHLVYLYSNQPKKDSRRVVVAGDVSVRGTVLVASGAGAAEPLGVRPQHLRGVAAVGPWAARLGLASVCVFFFFFRVCSQRDEIFKAHEQEMMTEWTCYEARPKE